jgi:hypothetical protein
MTQSRARAGSRRLVWAAVVAALATARIHAGPDFARAASGKQAERGSDEAPPVLTASKLLPPDLLRGPHHTVEELVRTAEYFHVFTISSPVGQFTADGLSQVPVLAHEIDALVKLDDVSKTEVFLAAAGRSVVNVGKGAASAVTDPVATARGLGSGIKRFGVNLGRRTERAVDSARSDEEAEEDAKENAAVAAGNSLLGVNAALRRWAQKVGVDPYTRNAVLLDALGSIAKVDAAGGIATKVALPIPPLVGMTADVGDLVWGKDPEALRKLNEQRLRELGVADDIAAALFRNHAHTLTTQTRLIAALYTVRAAGSDDYVKTASEAKRAREALFFVESAELLQAWHARTPVSRLLTDSRALVATTKDGHVAALLPLDWLRSTAASSATLKSMTTRATSELGATRRTLVLTGKASPRATREIAELGWTIVGAPK